VGLLFLFVTAIWWVTFDAWDTDRACRPDCIDGLGSLDAVYLWYATGIASVLVWALAVIFRPAQLRARILWAIAFAGIVFVANAQSLPWAMAVALLVALTASFPWTNRAPAN
jgi:hypothetical protein